MQSKQFGLISCLHSFTISPAGKRGPKPSPFSMFPARCLIKEGFSLFLLKKKKGNTWAVDSSASILSLHLSLASQIFSPEVPFHPLSSDIPQVMYFTLHLHVHCGKALHLFNGYIISAWDDGRSSGNSNDYYTHCLVH